MTTEATEHTQLTETVRHLETQMELLEERNSDLMTQVALAVDDLGWKPLGGLTEGDDQIPLSNIQSTAETCRALITVNPLIKRAVAVRTSYIWGEGVQIGAEGDAWRTPSLVRVLASPQAQYELERSLAGDGNVSFLVDVARKKIQRLPFRQLTATITAPGDDEDVWFYRRSWNEEVRPFADPSAAPEAVQRREWYPSYDRYKDDGADKPKTIAGDAVDYSKVVVTVSANKLAGWTWGLPDVFPVIFWSQAYKEFLEDCKKLLKSYAQYAWKVTSATGKGQKAVASKIADQPLRDPMTGGYANVGNTAVLGAGQDLSALGKNSSSVNFNEGRALAALVAAGLEVPLPVMLSDPSGNAANSESLEPVTGMAMKARQRLWDAAGRQIADLLGFEWDVVWPPVTTEPTHRLIQAITMADGTGMLYPEEVRAMLLRALDYDSDREEPPEPAPPAPAPGADGMAQVEPPSYGDHELRDEGLQAHTD